jgi:hypothetical protein
MEVQSRVVEKVCHHLIAFLPFQITLILGLAYPQNLAAQPQNEQKDQKFSLFPDNSPPRFPIEREKIFFTVVAFGSGMGQFQDIQVPVNPEIGTRIDGKPVGAENTDHFGIPLYLTGETIYQSRLSAKKNSNTLYWTVVRGSILTMSAQTGPDDTINSSYSRVTLGTSLGLGTAQFGLGTVRTHWTTSLDYRRSSFGYISSAHFIESPMVTLQADLSWQSFSLLISSGVGLQPKFGFSQELFWGGKELPSSRASINTAELSGSWVLTPHSTFVLGVDIEQAEASIEDAGDYASFDLRTDGLATSRQYQLGTWISKIGIETYF